MRLQRELAKAIGITARQVRDNVKAGAPKEPDGQFCVEDFRAWRSANLNERAKGNAAAAAGNLELTLNQVKTQAAIQQINLSVERSRWEFEKLKGNLVDVEQARRDVAEVILVVKQTIEAIPAAVERDFPAETRIENRRKLDRKISLALKQLAALAAAISSAPS